VPSSKEEVIDIVTSVAMRGGRVRVVGSGHSWSGVAQSQDILVSLHKLKGMVRIDRERKEVCECDACPQSRVPPITTEYSI